MISLWDIPPHPTLGNTTREIVYEAVGQALSAWESLELDLACLYATFLSVRPTQAISNPEYTAARIFKERADVINRAGEKYFRAHPSQALEAEAETLILESRLASSRRNDIAHGIVGLVWTYKNSSADYFMLMPSNYKRKDFDNYGTPRYAFSSKEINSFGEAFQRLGRQITEINHRIIASP